MPKGVYPRTQYHIQRLKKQFSDYREKVKQGKLPKLQSSLTIKCLENLKKLLTGEVVLTYENSSKIRVNLIRFGFKENKCEKVGCTTGPLWLGEPIIMVITIILS